MRNLAITVPAVLSLVGLCACNGLAQDDGARTSTAPAADPGAVTPERSEGRGAVEVIGTDSLADATRVNAAIAASPPGSEIVFRGTFLLDQTVRLTGRRAYRGESRSGTLFRQADGVNLPALMASSVFLDDKTWTGSPISIRHLKLDGNAKNNTEAATTGIVLRAWLSVVEDVHIANMSGDGLRLTNLGIGGAKLNTTQVNGRISGCFIERSGRHGVFVEDTQNKVTDWILSDSWIAGSGADGIHLDNAAGWCVERNHIYGVKGNAIHAHRLFATSIADNYIEGFGEGEEAGAWYGIRATLQGGAASTICGNRIFNFHGEKQPASDYRYLGVLVNYGTGVVSVTGNAIRGKGTPRGTGLHYTTLGETDLVVTSTGNIVHNVHTDRVVGDRVTLSAGL
jgi:hypothetical protein